MSNYLNILSSLPEAKIKEKEKAIEQGAKEEIKEAKERIAELQEDPGKTYNQPVERFVSEEEKKLKKYLDKTLSKVAEGYMGLVEEEAKTLKAYTEQIFGLQKIEKLIHGIFELSEEFDGKDYYENILTWVKADAEKIKVKIQQTLLHSKEITEEYIEFTGIGAKKKNEK